MININGEMQELIDTAHADGLTCLVGTASADGYPQISPKGSVLVFDPETLAYWERARRSALDNVAANPNVVIYYRNPARHLAWRFHGAAEVYDNGPIWEEVMARTIQGELDRDPERQGAAVLVRLEHITDLTGNVLQQKD